MDKKKKLLLYNAITSGGPSYSPEAQAVFSGMPDSMPTILKNAYADFIDSQVTSSNWSKIIDGYYFASNTQSNSIKAWKDKLGSGVLSNAYFTPYSDVYTQGDTNSYFDTNFIANDVVEFGLNDAAISIFVKYNNSKNTGAKYLYSTLEAASDRQAMFSQNGAASSNITVRLNGTTGLTYTDSDGWIDDHSLITLARTSASTITVYVNGVQVATSAVNTSGGKATVKLYLGARNNAGVASGYLDCSYKCFFIHKAVGFDLVSFYTNLVQLNYDVDMINPNVLLADVMGQSNAGGAGEVNRLVALTDYTINQVGAKVWQKSTMDITNNGNWRKMILGINNAEIVEEPTKDIHGVEASLSRKLLESLYPFYMCKSARGGSYLASEVGNYNDWDPTSGNLDLFEVNKQGFFNPSLAKLVAEYPNKTVKIFAFWHQGESDSQVPADLAAYKTNFLAFITAWRAIDARNATAPFIMCKLWYNRDAAEDAFNVIVDEIVSENANVYSINPGPLVAYPRKMDLPAEIRAAYPPTAADNEHNSYEFQVKAGELVYAKLIEIGYL